MIKKILFTVIVLVLSLLVLGLIKVKGVDAPVILPENIAVQFKPIKRLSCESYRIPTLLSASSRFSFHVVGELCWLGEWKNQPLQILISGAGYGPVYWDFPYQPDIYSYKKAALKKGYATFNYYRIGIGASDRPFGGLVTVESHVFVLSQIIHILEQKQPAAIVTVGHSLGSVIALAHAKQLPGIADAIVLTGFLHNSNPAFNLDMRGNTGLAATAQGFIGDIIDPLYMVSKANTRQTVFYRMDNADPLVPMVDELNRQTLTVGEIVSMIKYFSEDVSEVSAPVLIVTGVDDYVVCGGELNCSDYQAVVENEQSYFSGKKCLDIIMVEDAGHNLNLHRNAPFTYRAILDWIDKKISTDCVG